MRIEYFKRKFNYHYIKYSLSLIYEKKYFALGFGSLSFLNAFFQSLSLGLLYLVIQMILENKLLYILEGEYWWEKYIHYIEDSLSLYFLGSMSILLTFISFLLSLISDFIQAEHVKNQEIKIRKEIFHKTLNSSWVSLSKINNGKFINLILKEAEYYKAIILCNYFILNYAIQVFVFLIILINISTVLFLLTIIIGILYTISFFPILNRSSKLGLENTLINQVITDSLLSMIRSIKNIKVENAQEFIKLRIDKQIENLSNTYKKQKILASIQSNSGNILMSIFVMGIFYFSYEILGLKLSIIGLFFGLLVKIINLLQQIVDNLNRSASAFPSLDVIRHYMDNLNFENNTKKIKDVNLSKEINIVFKNFTLNHANKIILQNFNFEFKTNNLYLLLGQTGSGKTTFLDSISGLHNQYTGEILIEGNNLQELKTTFLQKYLTYQTQSNYMFDGSLYENLTWGIDSNFTKDDIFNALKAAEIYDNYLERGEDYIIHDGGTNLSGGERQRYALARILLQNKKIILLDEPTSALDEKTEQKIFKNLLEYKNNRILLIVTHKKELFSYADYAISINDQNSYSII